MPTRVERGGEIPLLSRPPQERRCCPCTASRVYFLAGFEAASRMAFKAGISLRSGVLLLNVRMYA